MYACVRESVCMYACVRRCLCVCMRVLSAFLSVHADVQTFLNV